MFKIAICYLCEKATVFGKKVSMSHSHVSGRSNRPMKPNLKKVKILENGTPKTVYLCTRCLRSNLVTRKVSQ